MVLQSLPTLPPMRMVPVFHVGVEKVEVFGMKLPTVEVRLEG